MSQQTRDFRDILNQLFNGQAKHHFGVETLREDYSATIEITDPTGLFFLEYLEEMGFETTKEREDIYTVEYGR